MDATQTCIMPTEPEERPPHAALFYRQRDEFADGVLRFIEPALEAQDPVLVAVPGPSAEMLRDALPDEARLLDMHQLARNPGRMIHAVQRMFPAPDHTHLHFVSQPIWSGRSPEEIREAVRQEALINLAWEGAPVRVLCPYDAASLEQEVLADAERTHEVVIADGNSRRSETYVRAAIPDGCLGPLGDPPSDATSMWYERPDLHEVRALVEQVAVAAGLDVRQVGDLVAAVNELTTNTILHAHPPGLVRAWVNEQGVVAQVEDDGFISDPLAGKTLPSPDTVGGRGLWLVNELCDLVELRSSPAGSKVRVHAMLGD